MVIEVVLALLGLPALLAQSSNCTSKFETDWFVGNIDLESVTGPLDCFIHYRRTKYTIGKEDDAETSLHEIWHEAKCLDEHTIIFNSLGSTDKDNVEEKRFLLFICISTAPIKIRYSGQLPSAANLFADFYDPKSKLHLTTLNVPFESSKSGNYTFELLASKARSTKWVYVYFNMTNVQFIRPDFNSLEEIFADPSDPLNIVIPCVVNGPEQRPVVLVNASQNNVTYKYVPGKGIVTKQANFAKNLHLISDERNNTELGPHRVVQCYLPGSSNLTVDVLSSVYVEKRSEKNKLGGSDKLKLRINSESKLECYSPDSDPLEAQTLQIFNYYFAISSEWPFVSQCREKCTWSPHWTDTGDFIRDPEILLTQQTCTDIKCNLNEPFRSGLIRCSSKIHSYPSEHFTGLYFTGLDNRIYLLADVEKLQPYVVINMSVIQSDGITSQSNIYAGETILLECNAVYFVLLPGISWILTFRNGTESLRHSITPSFKDFQTFKTNGIFKERLTLTVPRDAQTIQCAAFLRDTLETFIKASNNVYLRVPPTVVENPKSSYTIRRNESKTVLNCVMKGDPQPTLYWTTNEGKNLSDVVVHESDGCVNSELTILNVWRPLQKQTFTCVGVSSLGVTRAEFLVVMEKEELTEAPWGIGVIAGVVAGFVGLIAAFILVIVLVTRKYKAVISSKDISWFLNGDQTAQSAEDEINYSSQPYRTQKEVLQRDFSIDKDFILGSGSYGVVMKGHVRGQEVAVKTVKPNPSREVVMALLAEIKIMSSLADHPNVVSYIGAHTTNISKGEMYLFVELCSLGTVQKFLKTTNTSRCESNTPPNEEHDSHLLKRLVNWSLQTVRGMKYLSECRVIHGDLAVRNLLLKDMDTVKITDFGLARQLQNYTIYKKTQQQPLPWRHMSPESLSAMEFSTKSDVWAFGVTMWEMFSLGAIPYTGLQWTIEFTSLLESGLRLDQRKFCPPAIYTVMQKCWDWIPNARPGFAQLQAELQQIYISDYDNDYLDVGENNTD